MVHTKYSEANKIVDVIKLCLIFVILPCFIKFNPTLLKNTMFYILKPMFSFISIYTFYVFNNLVISRVH